MYPHFLKPIAGMPAMGILFFSPIYTVVFWLFRTYFFKTNRCVLRTKDNL